MPDLTAEVVTSEVAPAADAAPAPESTADQATEAPEGGDKPIAPERTFTQAELDAINAKTKAQAERRALKAAARVEAERDLYKRQLEDAQRPAQQPQPQSGAPQVKDFQDYEQYLVAKAKFEIRQELSQQAKETDEQQRKRQAHESQSERARIVNERLDAVAEEIPDVRELLQDDSLPFTEPMVAALLELETGGKVAGYLATHRDEAAKIAKLSPVNQVIEYYELGKRLTAAPRPTQTPPPIAPPTGRAPVEKRLEDATSQDEFNAIRRRQIAARQGRWK